jgi:hypothetical protein
LNLLFEQMLFLDNNMVALIIKPHCCSCYLNVTPTEMKFAMSRS